jgi:hypothetical protein
MIYFISTNDVADYPIKIGVTGIDFRARFQLFQTTCPYRLEPIAIVEGDPSIERVLHVEFAADRLMGEWFKRTPRLMGAIDLLADTAMREDALRGIVSESMTYKDRQREGIQKAKGAGLYKGRKPTARAKSEDVRRLAADGMTREAIAAELNIGVASVYRALRVDTRAIP